MGWYRGGYVTEKRYGQDATTTTTTTTSATT